tara:strand:- start:1475 stop:2272 length:798 start_codon:yes stop_codon:yes gene_type:complete
MDPQEIGDIDLIRTDKFNIGFMGRSGSRTIMKDIVGRAYAHYPLLASFSNFNDKQILEEQGSIPHILVLRDPVERAASGSLLALYPEYHGHPFLHLIDFDVVTHIIRFEDLGEYFSSHEGFVTEEQKKDFDVDSFDAKEKVIDSERKRIFQEIVGMTPRERYLNVSDIFYRRVELPELSPKNEEDPDSITFEEAQNLREAAEKIGTLPPRNTNCWDYTDMSFTHENALYEKFLNEKPRMDPVLFKELMNNITKLNCRNNFGYEVI